MLCVMLRYRGRRLLWAGIGLGVIFVALTFSFVSNGFGVAPGNEWAAWERGSEAMVMKRIEVDLMQSESHSLGLADYAGDEFTVYERLSAANGSLAPQVQAFEPYESEIGGQAYFWSSIWRDLGCSSISCVHLVASGLTAGSVLAIFLCLSLIGAGGLAWAWLISVACSPWITFAARNLFWSPWLYFLPSIAATVLVVARPGKWRWFAAFGVLVAFTIKYIGTGYHEFTAFTMLAAAMPVIAILFKSQYVRSISRQLINVVLILGSSIVAMALVLVVHAQLLSGNVLNGLNQIWINTILRRTYGDASNFDPVTAESLSVSPVTVVGNYIWSSWWTDLMRFSLDKQGSVFSVSLGRGAFVLLIAVSIAIVLKRLWSRDPLWKRDAGLFVLGFLIPVMWFVAAKGYSYIHTFILFFLWYFLFVAVLIFIPSSFALSHRTVTVRRLRAFFGYP